MDGWGTQTTPTLARRKHPDQFVSRLGQTKVFEGIVFSSRVTELSFQSFHSNVPS